MNTESSGGLTLGAANLKQHMAGWSHGESSNGFIPAYKVSTESDLVGELVAAGEWIAITQGGITYGYDIAMEDGPVILDATVAVAEQPQSITEAQADPAEVDVMDRKDAWQEPSEALQRIIDAVPHHDLHLASREPNQTVQGGFSEEELEDGFEEFLAAYEGVQDSNRLFKSFSQAAKRSMSITKIVKAAEEYSTAENRPALRWLNDEDYLATSIFQHQP